MARPETIRHKYHVETEHRKKEKNRKIAGIRQGVRCRSREVVLVDAGSRRAPVDRRSAVPGAIVVNTSIAARVVGGLRRRRRAGAFPAHSEQLGDTVAFTGVAGLFGRGVVAWGAGGMLIPVITFRRGVGMMFERDGVGFKGLGAEVGVACCGSSNDGLRGLRFFLRMFFRLLVDTGEVGTICLFGDLQLGSVAAHGIPDFPETREETTDVRPGLPAIADQDLLT